MLKLDHCRLEKDQIVASFYLKLSKDEQYIMHLYYSKCKDGRYILGEENAQDNVGRMAIMIFHSRISKETWAEIKDKVVAEAEPIVLDWIKKNKNQFVELEENLQAKIENAEKELQRMKDELALFAIPINENEIAPFATVPGRPEYGRGYY